MVMENPLEPGSSHLEVVCIYTNLEGDVRRPDRLPIHPAGGASLILRRGVIAISFNGGAGAGGFNPHVMAACLAVSHRLSLCDVRELELPQALRFSSLLKRSHGSKDKKFQDFVVVCVALFVIYLQTIEKDGNADLGRDSTTTRVVGLAADRVFHF